MIPCAKIVLQKKDFDTYSRMIYQLLKLIAGKYNLELNPEVLLTDFEKYIQKAYKLNWTTKLHWIVKDSKINFIR